MRLSKALKQEIKDLFKDEWRQYIEYNHYNDPEYGYTEEDILDTLEGFAEEWITDGHEDYLDAIIENAKSLNDVTFKTDGLDYEKYQDAESLLQDFIEEIVEEIKNEMNKKLNLTEAEEDNTPIEGQIGFDEYEDNLENGEYIYETNFRLECPVNDIDEAQAYLEEDRMAEYLWSDDRNNLTEDDVSFVDWILEDEESGVIRVRAKRELTEAELEQISEWIKGQNSDGLGEGFEQQYFAESYFNPVTGEGPYDRSRVEREIERLYEEIDVDDLVTNGYLDNEIWEAVDNYKDENSSYDEDSEEEFDDDEIYDLIASDVYSYLDEEDIEKAKQEYIDGDDEFNENKWYNMASFDWQTNDYKLHRID